MNVVIGIDPGTTTAYAAFELSGRFIAANSGRGLSLSEILNKTIGLRIVGVATDRREVPELVRKFAAARGARIFAPPQDLSLEDKKELLKRGELQALKNAHERDAAAAALWALKSMGGLLSRFERAGAKAELDELEREMAERRIILFGENISSAISNSKNEKTPKGATEDFKTGRVTSEGSGQTSEFKLRSYESVLKESELLRNQNIRLRLYISKLKRKIGKIKKARLKSESDFQKKIEERLVFKEDRIKVLAKRVSQLEEEVNLLRGEIERIVEAALSTTRFEIIPKVESLSLSHDQLKILIHASFVYVENPEKFSEHTLRELGAEKVLISNKKFPKCISSQFTVIDASKLELKDIGRFLTCDKDQLKKVLESDKIFERIIEEYRRERMEK
ncbi:MAG: DUF460 domain-containing protein [Candidatus Woesearchaeota archaeon]